MSEPQAAQQQNNRKKKFILMRHSHKDQAPRKDMLSIKGVVIARHEGMHLIEMGITHCFGSQMTRAMQTLYAIIDGAQLNIPLAPKSVDLLGGFTMNQWIDHCDHGSTLSEIREAYPEFIDEATQNLFQIFREIDRQVPEGAVVLIVGHSPTTELLYEKLTGKVVVPLKECEGLVFEVDEHGNITTLDELRHPS